MSIAKENIGFLVNRPSGSDSTPVLNRKQRKMVDEQLKRLERSIKTERHSIRKSTSKKSSKKPKNVNWAAKDTSVIEEDCGEDYGIEPIPLKMLLEPAERSALAELSSSSSNIINRGAVGGNAPEKTKSMIIMEMDTQQVFSPSVNKIPASYMEQDHAGHVDHKKMKLQGESTFLTQELEMMYANFVLMQQDLTDKDDEIQAGKESLLLKAAECTHLEAKVADQAQQISQLTTDLTQMKKDYFFALALGVKMSELLQGRSVNTPAEELFERAPLDSKAWPQWIAQNTSSDV
eukprot:ANDGO_01538.mRNA.1 hypothetical protein